MRATETDIVIQELKDENGSTVFGWRFLVDNEVHADGYEATHKDATRKAKMARSEWEDAGRDDGEARRFEEPTDATGAALAVGDRVEFLEPYQGFAGGTVVELLRGVMGPIAGVRVEPNRTVDTLCRRLRKV